MMMPLTRPYSKTRERASRNPDPASNCLAPATLLKETMSHIVIGDKIAALLSADGKLMPSKKPSAA